MTENRYRAALASRAAELSRMLGNRSGLQVESAADELDQILLRSERELTAERILRESKLLRDVRAALARLDDGSYGVCARCEEDISQKRLNAIPWTRYCLHCQEQIDQENGAPASEGFLAAA